jgi:hypothetical protein
MNPTNKWTFVFDEKNSPRLVGISLNEIPIAVRSLTMEQGVGQVPVIKLEILLHNDTLETVHL